jgi:rubrerythrin
MAETFKKYAESWVNTLTNLKDKKAKFSTYEHVSKTMSDLANDLKTTISGEKVTDAEFNEKFVEVATDAHIARLGHYIKSRGLPSKITLPVYKMEDK